MTRARDTASIFAADGSLNISTSVNLGDNEKAYFGTSNDLQIYHDGSNSWLRDTGTGNLYIQGSSSVYIRGENSEFLASFGENSATTLYYDGSAKLATTSGGIDVTGSVTADGLTVDGDATINDPTPSLTLNDTNGTNQKFTVSHNGSSSFLKFRDGVSYAGLQFIADNGTSERTRMNIAYNGDVSLYDSTGVSQGFFWDASTQRLGLGATGPTAKIHVVGDNSDGTNLATSASNAKVKFQNHSGSSLSSHEGYTGSSWYQQISNSTGTTAYDLSLNPYGGNVGIGTTSPPTILSILGDAEYISIGNNSENYSGIVMYDNQSAVQSGGIHYSSTGTNGNVVSIFNDLTTSYGGADRFSVDSSGRITMPDQPGFCVYMTGTYTREGDGTKIDPTWGSDHNVGSHFDTATSVFTAPVAGRYLFSWNIAHAFSGSSNTGDAWSILPTKNGSDIFNFQGFYGDGGVESGVEGQHAGTVIVNLAANDTVYLKTSGTSATTINFLTGSNFSGYLLG